MKDYLEKKKVAKALESLERELNISITNKVNSKIVLGSVVLASSAVSQILNTEYTLSIALLSIGTLLTSWGIVSVNKRFKNSVKSMADSEKLNDYMSNVCNLLKMKTFLNKKGVDLSFSQIKNYLVSVTNNNYDFLNGYITKSRARARNRKVRLELCKQNTEMTKENNIDL